MDKQELRKQYLAKRDVLPQIARNEANFIIAQKLLLHPKFKEAQKILLYASKGSEVDTFSIIEEALRLSKKVYLPKVEGQELRIYGTRGLGDLKSGAFGVLEPTLAEEIDPAELDLIIMPGVAFDRSGARIGYGKGFYDRLLKKTKAYTIGLAYHIQLAKKVPQEEHDLPVDELVTNN